MGKDKKQTTTQRLDPSSQGFVDQQRRQAQGAADVALGQPGSFFTGPTQASQVLGNMSAFMNPYTNQVIGGVQDQFNQLRGEATVGTNQQAAQAGAFGGARHGLAQGQRLGQLDQAQASTIGGMLSNQFNNALNRGMDFTAVQQAQRQQQLQEPLFRQQAAQGFYSGGLGPVGQTTEQITPGNFWGDLAGGALIAGGAMLGGPGRNPLAPGAGVSAPAGLMNRGFSSIQRQPVAAPTAFPLRFGR